MLGVLFAAHEEITNARKTQAQGWHQATEEVLRMANDAFRVAQKGDVFRVVRDGSPVASIDNGGFSSRQAALDAAMQANVQNRKLGTGKADQARSSLQNRTNRIDEALSGAQ